MEIFLFFFCKRKKNFYRINYFRGLPFGGGFLCSSINLKISRKSFFILAAMCCGRILRVSCSYEKKKNDEKKKKKKKRRCIVPKSILVLYYIKIGFHHLLYDLFVCRFGIDTVLNEWIKTATLTIHI